MSTTAHETSVHVSEEVPSVTLSRVFEASRDRVFHAFVDPDMFVRWVGPRGITTTIDRWEAVTGGGYRWSNVEHGEIIACFYGSYHEVREPSRIVQTQTFAMLPDAVLLETILFEELEDGRSRVTSTSLLDSFEARDGLVSSGMEHGVREGYEKLDELLAAS